MIPIIDLNFVDIKKTQLENLKSLS